MVSEEIKEKVKGLKMEYKDSPQPELLIAIPNSFKDVDYLVEDVSPEFTSLCPLNLYQPDFAVITVKYRPNELLVELKSLKFYLVSFRMCPIFHEEVPGKILKDLVELLNPHWIEVRGEFSVRGGLHTTVEAIYENEEVAVGLI